MLHFVIKSCLLQNYGNQTCTQIDSLEVSYNAIIDDKKGYDDMMTTTKTAETLCLSQSTNLRFTSINDPLSPFKLLSLAEFYPVHPAPAISFIIAPRLLLSAAF